MLHHLVLHFSPPSCTALAALGWVGGMFSMAIFAGIVYAFAHMLIMCHQKGDGKRYRTYYSAVHNILGKRHAIAYVWICTSRANQPPLTTPGWSGFSKSTSCLLHWPMPSPVAQVCSPLPCSSCQITTPPCGQRRQSTCSYFPSSCCLLSKYLPSES